MTVSTSRLGGRAPWSLKWGYVVGAALIVALTVLLTGSYAGGWWWTGFSANGTLWDWLHLLVLPLVVATLPLWYRAFQTRHGHGDHRRRRHSRWRPLLSRRRWWIWALVALLLAFVVVAVGGYGFSWTWTGFKGNTLWDWVNLLGVPTMLPLAVFWLTRRARESQDVTGTTT